MGFNSAFKGLKIVKNPGNGRLNNLNNPVLNVLSIYVPIIHIPVNSVFTSAVTGLRGTKILSD